MIGVLTFVSLSPQGGSIVQGFNFLIPARDVRTFVEDTEVRARPRERVQRGVDRRRSTALFGERYPTAVTRLTEANALLPNLPDVKRALAEADSRSRIRRPGRSPGSGWPLGVTLVSVGAYGGMFGQRWWKNRLPHPARPGHRPHGGRKRPVLVDVRTKSDYETSPLKLPGARRLSPEEVDAGRVDLTARRRRSSSPTTRAPRRPRARGSPRCCASAAGRTCGSSRAAWAAGRTPGCPWRPSRTCPRSGSSSTRTSPWATWRSATSTRARSSASRATIPGRGLHRPRGHGGDSPARERQHRVLTQLGEGELVGEMALFRRGKRSADIVAATDVELLVIKNERLEWLIHNRPEVTMEILKRLSETSRAQSQTSAAREAIAAERSLGRSRRRSSGSIPGCPCPATRRSHDAGLDLHAARTSPLAAGAAGPRRDGHRRGHPPGLGRLRAAPLGPGPQPWRDRSQRPRAHRCRLSRRDQGAADQSRRDARSPAARRSDRSARDPAGGQRRADRVSTLPPSERGTGGFGSTGS